MQVFVIHGGGTFSTYEGFIEYLKTAKIELEKEEHRDWKKNLKVALGDSHDVILPQMPNKQNARYSEWKLWFERHLPFIQDGVVLVGHSLGGMFLAKYLSENDFPRTIRSTFLVASPSADIVGFELGSLKKLEAQGGAIHLYHSKDDAVVAFEELTKFQAALPHAQVHIFNDRGHFNQEAFPELVSEIQKLT